MALRTLAHKLRVGIVGVGTAGPTTALALSAAGHSVTIFDRVDEIQPVGAGIGMQPIGLTVLHHLNLLRPILNHGARIDHLHGVTRKSGRDVLDLRYADLDPRLFGVGLHRGVLLAELLHAMETREGPDGEKIDIRHPVDVVELRHRDDSRVAVVDSTGASHGPFDLVVVADGAKSDLRQDFRWPQHYKPYPFGCLWTILPDHERVFCDSATLSQVYEGSRHMLGFLPTGKTHAGFSGTEPSPPADAPNTVSLFWSIPTAQADYWRSHPLQEWKDKILSFEPRAASLLDQVTSHDDIAFASYADVSMPKFGAAPVVAIGDCAHAMSPQLGQGANVALVDGWKLGRAVNSATCGGSDSGPAATPAAAVTAAIQAYNAERRWRTWFYQANSRLLTPVFQSHSRVVGALRDAFMGPLCRLPPSRWQMIATMAGALHPSVVRLLAEEEFLGFRDSDYFKDSAQE